MGQEVNKDRNFMAEGDFGSLLQLENSDITKWENLVRNWGAWVKFSRSVGPDPGPRGLAGAFPGWTCPVLAVVPEPVETSSASP